MWVLPALLACALVAWLFPEQALTLQPALKPLFALTMFFVGSLVTGADVRAFAHAPSRTFTGLAAQYTIMPLSAFAIAQLFSDPLVRVGIVLTGCMPGAMASNVMTVLLRGDVLLSISMTTVATLVSPLILGFWLPLLVDKDMALPIGAMILDALWMVVLPAAAGIALRVFGPGLGAAWSRVATALAGIAILVVIGVVVAANRDRLAYLGPFLALAMLGLNLAGYGLAYAFGRLLGWQTAQRRTLVVEVGMQNAGLGSVLALSHLGAAGAVPSAFYTVLCVATAALALPLLAGAAAANGEEIDG